MKELSIEEKAKAYDEAIERAKKQLDEAKVFDYEDEQIAHDIRTTTYDIFPELKESEDERIRKKLIDYFKGFLDGYEDTYKVGGGVTWEGLDVKDVIAWLEKKGEQKPAWSEEDEENLNWFEKFFRAESVVAEGKDIPQDRYLWFKNLKDRVQPQPKQEWSEEDEIAFDDALWCCKQAASIAKDENDMGSVWYAENWLQYLKDRYTWKPSDEQMEALRIAGEIGSANNSWAMGVLKGMYQDLKKLKD